MSEQAYGETYSGSGETKRPEFDAHRVGITRVVKTFGHIDILVCNSGIQIISPLEALSLAG